jgi:hypothetical protein
LIKRQAAGLSRNKKNHFVVSVLNKVKTESVYKCTGHHWDQWIAILEKVGASQWTHREIVEHIRKKYKLNPWWQQLITSSYEIHIGRKLEGRNDKGEYATVATKTYQIGQKNMWNFLVSPQGLKIWLSPMSPLIVKPGEQYEIEGGIFGEVRTMKKPQRIRLSWQETETLKKTIVQIMVIPRPREKCVLAIQHEKLPSASAKEKMLRHWKNVLKDLEVAIPRPQD